MFPAERSDLKRWALDIASDVNSSQQHLSACLVEEIGTLHDKTLHGVRVTMHGILQNRSTNEIDGHF